MPSREVFIKNNWHKDHKEEFRGKEYLIPAGEVIRLPRYEAVALMGHCTGYIKWDGDVKEYPFAKALDMIEIPESGEINQKETFISPKTGEEFPNQDALNKHLGYIGEQENKDSRLVQALLDGLSKLAPQQTTTVSRVYACARCDFETTNKAAYLKHSEAKHEHNGSHAPSVS